MVVKIQQHGGVGLDIVAEVERLIRCVRELEDRVRELEGEDSGESVVSCIGFEASGGDEFDEDESEYRR